MSAESSPPVTEANTVEAVLWDFDGTLVDSEPFWIEAEFALVAEHGGTWTMEQALSCVGESLPSSADKMLAVIEPGHGYTTWDWVGLLVERAGGVMAQHEINWRPGAERLLRELSATGVRQALVTSSPNDFIRGVIERLDPMPFETIVTAETVSRHKPDPEPYLHAASALGVDVTRCVVLEDSRAGTAAALAAGARVVTAPSVDGTTYAQTDILLDSLADVTADHLLDTFWK
jgi:beta-phosphoglucomutase-like phosphatase (HAD superfamily)